MQFNKYNLGYSSSEIVNLTIVLDNPVLSYLPTIIYILQDN